MIRVNNASISKRLFLTNDLMIFMILNIYLDSFPQSGLTISVHGKTSLVTMKLQAVIFAIVAIFIFSAGCTNVLPPMNPIVTPSSQPTASSNPPARYGYGDVVIANTGDEIGEVIVGFNPANDAYTSRRVIFDQYGQIFYHEGGRTMTMNRATFEYQYPHKRATVNDPYGLANMDKDYSTKYGVGSTVQDPHNPGKGIKILFYDYPRDVYTYVYVHNQGGTWVNDTNSTFEGARTDIEDRFK
jgi:hypothetical protein